MRRLLLSRLAAGLAFALAAAPALGAPPRKLLIVVDEATTVDGPRASPTATSSGGLPLVLQKGLATEGWVVVPVPQDASAPQQLASARAAGARAGAEVVLFARLALQQHDVAGEPGTPKVFPMTGVVELVALSTADGVVLEATCASLSVGKPGDAPKDIQARMSESYERTAHNVVARSAPDALLPGLQKALAKYLASHPAP